MCPRPPWKNGQQYRTMASWMQVATRQLVISQYKYIMCVFMYICHVLYVYEIYTMCVYMRIYIYISYIYISISISISVYIYIYTYTYIHIHIHTHTYTYTSQKWLVPIATVELGLPTESPLILSSPDPGDLPPALYWGQIDPVSPREELPQHGISGALGRMCNMNSSRTPPFLLGII